MAEDKRKVKQNERKFQESGEQNVREDEKAQKSVVKLF